MPQDGERPPGSDDPHASAFERHLGVFFGDSTLWPVLAVGAGAGLSLGGALMVLVFQDRNVFALAALALLLLMSGDLWWRDLRRRRFGLVARCLLALWVGSFLAMLAVARLGIV